MDPIFASPFLILQILRTDITLPKYLLCSALSAVVQVVVAQEEACIDGLGQQGVDGNHDQEHSQLKDRVESEENRTGHHGQHPREDKVLEREKVAGQIQQECGPVILLVMDSSRSLYTNVC